MDYHISMSSLPQIFTFVSPNLDSMPQNVRNHNQKCWSSVSTAKKMCLTIENAQFSQKTAFLPIFENFPISREQNPPPSLGQRGGGFVQGIPLISYNFSGYHGISCFFFRISQDILRGKILGYPRIS